MVTPNRAGGGSANDSFMNMNLDPYDKTKTELRCAWIGILIFALLVVAALMLTSCSMYRSKELTVIDIGTGNRGFYIDENGNAHYWHGDIPESLDKLGNLVEKGAEGGARGAVQGVKGGL